MKWLVEHFLFPHLAWYYLQFFVVAQDQDVQDVQQQLILALHNVARAKVGVGELEWDDTVAAYSKNYANQRKADCSLQHSGGPYGENLFEEMGMSYAIRSCVTAWVEEKQFYDYDSNSCTEGQVCRHYTQVVWRDTVRLGCAPEVQCSNSSWFFFVCNYDPPGNIVGERPYVESAASKNVTAPPTNLTVSSKNMTKSPRSTNLTRVAGDLGNLTHSSGKTSSKLVPVLLGSAGGTALIMTLCLVFRGRIKMWARTDKNLAAQGNFGQVIFDYKVLRGSTGNFDRNNMVGKGGFGEVYKGRFPDGSYVAVKKLNERQTTQAVEEFLTEVKLITSVRHRNLVRLLGCCTRGHKRLLVYEFMSNNSLDKHLFGTLLLLMLLFSQFMLFRDCVTFVEALKHYCSRSAGEIRCALSWENRVNIIVGTARGLAYLHGDSNVRIIHRDIKCANILLDDKFHPKIADFGLARFFPENQTHVSTRVGGTIGYTAPEYAVHGQLTEKADVYSYGIVVLEIVSGRKCVDARLPARLQLLLEWAWNQFEQDQVLDIVDPSLEGQYPREQALKVITIALLCTQGSWALRPSMSEVALMLTDNLEITVQPTRPAFIDTSADRPANFTPMHESATSAAAPSQRSHRSISVSLFPR